MALPVTLSVARSVVKHGRGGFGSTDTWKQTLVKQCACTDTAWLHEAGDKHAPVRAHSPGEYHSLLLLFMLHMPLHTRYSSCYTQVTLHAYILFMHTSCSSCYIQVTLHAYKLLSILHTSYSSYHTQVALHATYMLLFMYIYSSCIQLLFMLHTSHFMHTCSSCIQFALHTTYATAYKQLFMLHTSKSSCYIQVTLHAYKLVFMLHMPLHTSYTASTSSPAHTTDIL